MFLLTFHSLSSHVRYVPMHLDGSFSAEATVCAILALESGLKVKSNGNVCDAEVSLYQMVMDTMLIAISRTRELVLICCDS